MNQPTQDTPKHTAGTYQEWAEGIIKHADTISIVKRPFEKWHLHDPTGQVATAYTEGAARRIRHRYNCHDELVAALEEAKAALLEIGRMAQARKSCIRMPNGLMLDNYVGQALSSNSPIILAINKAKSP